VKLLQGYVLREHWAPFAVNLAVLTAALLVGNVFKFADLVIAKGVSPFDILRLLLYLIPNLMIFTVPVACLVSMVQAFGRLSTDYELIAMRASGIAPIRLAAPLLTVALVISGLMLALSDRVVPEAHLAFRRQLKLIGVKRPTAYIEAGTFIKDFPPYVIFVYEVEGRTMHHVRIYEPKPQGPTRTIVANRGEFQSVDRARGVQLNLYDGTMDEWDPAHPGSLYKVSFGSYAMRLSADADAAGRVSKKLKEMTLAELAAERQRMAADGIDAVPIDVELHGKIAASFAALVFVVFGLALGLGAHHHERLITFVWVLAIFLAYYLGVITMSAIALKGWIVPWAAAWLPNLVGLAAGGAMLARLARA
jgi:LPS export ABC transporter permease LptF